MNGRNGQCGTIIITTTTTTTIVAATANGRITTGRRRMGGVWISMRGDFSWFPRTVQYDQDGFGPISI